MIPGARPAGQPNDASLQQVHVYRVYATPNLGEQLVCRTWDPNWVGNKALGRGDGHYRAVQPTPEMRVALPIAPREILASGDWLEDLETQVKANLASKPVLLVWGTKDMAFRPKFLARMNEVFSNRVVVELPEAKHYIQEDAPDGIIAAIIDRFG